MMDVDKRLLLAALRGDIAAGAALLDRLRDARDPRANEFNFALGRLVNAVAAVRKEYVATPTVAPGVAANALDADVEDADGHWAAAATVGDAYDEYRVSLSAIFWSELLSAKDIADTQNFLSEMVPVEDGDGEETGE